MLQPRTLLRGPLHHFRHATQSQCRHFRLASSPAESTDAPPIRGKGAEAEATSTEAAVVIEVPPGPRRYAIPPPASVRPRVSASASAGVVASGTGDARTDNGNTTVSASRPNPDTETESATPKSATAEASSSSSPFAQWAIPPLGSLSAPSLADLQARVPDEYTKRIEEWKRDFENWKAEMSRKTSRNLSLLSLKVNEVTGYREVERLKQAVKDRERDLELRRAEAKTAKLEYEHAVSTRSTSQQNVNSLLERKHAWTDEDVAQFTRLVRSDHASRHAVTTTSQDLKMSELAVDKAFTALMQAILERYHEEQVWSDKIRSVSTWANIVALAANLIVFMGAIAFIEPWKRRRLVQGLEERMTGMMNQVDEQLRVLQANVASLEAPLQAAVAPAAASAVPVPPVQLPTELEPLVGPAPAPPAADMGPMTSQATLGREPGSPQASGPTSDDAAPTSATDSESASGVSPVTDAPSPSPIEQLSQHAAETAPESQQSRALAWISTQLGHVSPPSAERDLAAASVAGAVGGAVAVGLVSLLVSSFYG